MSSLYVEMANVAIALLKEFGAPVALPRETGGTINPINGAEIAGVDASTSTTGLLKSYKSSLIDGTTILSGDKELILSSEKEILPSDTPVVDGEAWNIVKINAIKPAGVVLVYFVQVRK